MARSVKSYEVEEVEGAPFHPLPSRALLPLPGALNFGEAIVHQASNERGRDNPCFVD